MAPQEGTFRMHVTPGGLPASGEMRITAQGELDSESSPSLLAAVQDVIRTGDTSELTLDLSALSFIDSTGMRALIEIERDAARGELPLVVVAAPEPLTELLRVSGVADRLRLVEERQTFAADPNFLERADLELAADRQAPSQARAMVRELLNEVVSDADLSGVALMTSELVTNAVVHTAPGPRAIVGLRVVVFSDHLRVEVDDPGAGFDPAEHLDVATVPGPGEGGRGLFVVDRTAARWGSRHRQTDRGRRFSVWFEIETD